MTDFMFQKSHDVPERVATVKLTERDLRAATQILQALVGCEMAPAESGGMAGSDCNVPQLSKADLAARARKVFTVRRRRAKVFGKSMFGEPAWDMLVGLYMDDAAGPRVTIGRLTELAETAPTTALRWLEYLEQHDLVRRQPHPTDRRTFFIELTDKGRSAMERFLSGTGL